MVILCAITHISTYVYLNLEIQYWKPLYLSNTLPQINNETRIILTEMVKTGIDRLLMQEYTPSYHN